MINRTELITLHIADLFSLVGKTCAVAGSLILMTNGEELCEVDLDDLCMVIKIESDTKDVPVQKPCPVTDKVSGHLKCYTGDDGPTREKQRRTPS